MNQLQIIEHQTQRVLTTAQIAEGYGATLDQIKANFSRNRDRYEVGKHFFLLEGDELRAFKDLVTNCNVVGDRAPALYLWTEKGALLHAKSLNTDQAWAVYDHLVETYFKVREQALPPMTQIQMLAAQAQAMLELERKSNEQALAIADTNARIDGIKEVVSLDTNSWREDTRKLIVRIADAWGGKDHIRDVHNEIYRLVESRGGVRLATRLENKRKNAMRYDGVCKSKANAMTKVDVIADDKKLIEIYTAIVKEMAVKYLDPKPDIQ